MASSDSRLAASRRAATRSALTAVACFLQMTRSLSILFYPLCLADSASVVRNGESCFSANIRMSGLASIMCCITTSWARSENGLSAMRRHASRNSQYVGHRVVEDQCPPPWSRRLPAPQYESYGPSREPSWLRSAHPSFSILRSPIPHRHELIEVNCILDEYSGYLEGAGLWRPGWWSDGGKWLERDHGYERQPISRLLPHWACHEDRGASIWIIGIHCKREGLV